MGDMNNNGNEQDNINLPEDLNNFEPFDDSNTIPLPSYNKKKSKNKMVIAISAVLLIVIAAGFLFRGYLVNQVMFLTKNPAQYYAYVEHKNIGSGIDLLSENYASTSDQYKKIVENGMGYNVTADLSISPEYAGLMGLSDLGNIKINSNVAVKELKQQISTELFYKDQSLVNLNIIYNIVEDSNIYLQVPELSNAYLLLSMMDLTAQEGQYQDIANSKMLQFQNGLYNQISAEELNQLLTKYTDIVINNLKNVEQNGSTELSISDVSGKYTSLTVQLREQDLYVIGKDILETAKADKDLQDLLVEAGLTADDYTSGIEEALQTLESNKDSITSSTEVVNMTVYIDGTGTIIGREFTASESTDTVGYYVIRKGTNFNYTAFYNQEGVSIANITGTAAYSANKISGRANITIDDTSNPIVATLEFKDLEQVKNSEYYNGTMTLTSDSFNGISLGLDLIGSAKNQEMNLKVLYGNIEGAALNIATKEVPYTEITLPSESDEIYSATNDIYGYMNSMDMAGFIDHVYNVTGIDLSTIFYGLLGF